MGFAFRKREFPLSSHGGIPVEHFSSLLFLLSLFSSAGGARKMEESSSSFSLGGSLQPYLSETIFCVCVLQLLYHTLKFEDKR